MSTGILDLADWRRRVAELYALVRAHPDPAAAHLEWQRARDELFRNHPQSPLLDDDPLRASGLPYWPYDPALRFEADLLPAGTEERSVPVAADHGPIVLRRVGVIRIEALDASLDVWWLAQYAGGIFVPVRDGTAGPESYGGGRYLLDTAKGADLGSRDGRLVVDFNFLYHPSCRYNPRWECPLAPAGNTIAVPLRAGERLPVVPAAT